MSLFLIIPEDEGGLAELLPVLGADERVSLGSWAQLIGSLRVASGGEAARLKSWSLYQFQPPDDERLVMVTEAVQEQIGAKGEAVLDLELKMVTVAELQAVAVGLGLSVGLVAVLKRRRGRLPPLVEAFDRELIATIEALGGTASTGQLASRLGRAAVPTRKRLQVLVRFGRLKQSGTRGGARYSLPEGQ
ncbi:MAG: hypothetical protein ACREMY_01370 [bacterium]